MASAAPVVFRKLRRERAMIGRMVGLGRSIAESLLHCGFAVAPVLALAIAILHEMCLTTVKVRGSGASRPWG